METAFLLGGVSLLTVFAGAIPLMFRRVVNTNEVHIVQSSKTTISYGREQQGGNTYYAWPAFLPIIGRKVTVLPMSIFQERLDNYQAYDKDRLPFMVDVIGFFQITDSNVAAQRNASFGQLTEQIKGIVQGAIRSILATHPLAEIMEGRSQFSKIFTDEVSHQLDGWGVKPVKPLELMDIRDVPNSKVIENIMSIKKSAIERDSRVAVAANIQSAQTAEITAKQAVDLQAQVAAEAVGTRTAEAEKKVALSVQLARQEVAQEEAKTVAKQMEVRRVNDTQNAAIAKATQIIAAEQARDTSILAAEGAKKKAELDAEGRRNAEVFLAEGEKKMAELRGEGQRNAAMFEAEGIKAKGEAEGVAATAIQMAPVNAQLALAAEIGDNEGYQKYLVTIEQVKTAGEVGKAQAAALEKANVKVFANSGTPTDGINDVSSLFSAAGGIKLASLLEGLAATPVGQAVAAKLVGKEAPAPAK